MILGYALIQFPDFALVIYGYLKKIIRKNSTPISDVSTGTHCNIELVSVSSLASHVCATDVEEGTDTRSFKDTTTNKLYKMEVLMATVIEKLEDISQRKDNAEINSNKYDALNSKVDQLLERQSRRIHKVDNTLNTKWQ